MTKAIINASFPKKVAIGRKININRIFAGKTTNLATK